MLLYLGDAGWAETTQLALELGLPLTSLRQACSHLPTPAISKLPTEPDITVRSYVSTEWPAPFTCAWCQVDDIDTQMRAIVGVAQDAESPVPLGALTQQLYLLIESGGYGDLDYSVIHPTIYSAKPRILRSLCGHCDVDNSRACVQWASQLKKERSQRD